MSDEAESAQTGGDVLGEQVTEVMNLLRQVEAEIALAQKNVTGWLDEAEGLIRGLVGLVGDDKV